MKARIGFVSNSSSCSFCIATKARTFDEFKLTLHVDATIYGREYNAEDVLYSYWREMKQVIPEVRIMCGRSGTEGQEDFVVYGGGLEVLNENITGFATND